MRRTIRWLSRLDQVGKTRMTDATMMNAISTTMLLRAIEAMYSDKRLIHLCVDNARVGARIYCRVFLRA
jgi:hypothetical protein